MKLSDQSREHVVSKHVSVHVLRHGRALCLAVHGLPCNWGHTHKWVSFLDPAAANLATCPTCREALALIPLQGCKQ